MLQEGHLAEAVSLRVPTALPLVIIFSAEYGSPAGSSRGRGTVRPSSVGKNRAFYVLPNSLRRCFY